MNESSRPCRILITGAGGFLAGELIRQLSNTSNHHIVALTSDKDKLRKRFPNVENMSIHSLCDLRNGDPALNSVDRVIHCAFAAYSLGRELSDSVRFTNEVLMWAADRRIRAFVNISSRSVYDKLNDLPRTEKTPVVPDTTYGMAKYATEILTENVARISGKTVITCNIRLAGLTGPGLNVRTTSRFVIQALRRKPIHIIGGKQQMSFLDVRDAASGIIALLSLDPLRWKNLYNLGSRRPYTILEWANTVSDVAKKRLSEPVEIVIEEKDVVLYDSMDSSLFFADTGWKPRYDMRAAIESLFEYFQTRSEKPDEP